MVQAAWEKDVDKRDEIARVGKRGDRWKFLVGGLLILAAVGYLIISGTATGAQFFITVDSLTSDPSYVGQTVRVSGAVDGTTISFDRENLIIEFTMSHIPEKFDNLADALHVSVTDPTASRVPVRVEGQVLPDLLSHEAQAIVTGQMGSDGVFHATELLLKCPSRFEELRPEQIIQAHPPEQES
ncbi:MAG: cytochrome c maturation protein CcmE [Chloroflexi bacterium]|nr:MAG: cytochrome c maturation protein CcmE [Chloroflexota bacterium]